MVRSLPCWLLLVCLLTCLLPGAAHADAHAARTRAAAHFEIGIARVEAGRFLEAALAFEDAYALSENPVVLYNVGMAYAAAERPEQAISALERYLAEAELQTGERERVEAELLHQRERLTALRANVASAVSEQKADSAASTTAASHGGSAPVALPDAPVEAHTSPVQGVAPAPARAGHTLLSARAGAAQRGRRLVRAAYAQYATALLTGIAAVSVYAASDTRFSAWQREQARIDAYGADAASTASADDPLLLEIARHQGANDRLERSATRLQHWAIGLGAAAGVMAATGAVLHVLGARHRTERMELSAWGRGLTLRAVF